jgi:hypothetical protein
MSSTPASPKEPSISASLESAFSTESGLGSTERADGSIYEAPISPSPSRLNLETRFKIPSEGEMCLGGWFRSGKEMDWYAMVILPIGDLEGLGISGSIYDTSLAKGHIPVCYKYNKQSRKIEGWADAFRDGGPRAADRKLPVMYFDDTQKLRRKNSLIDPDDSAFCWFPVRNIQPFSKDSPTDDGPVHGYGLALSFNRNRPVPICLTDRSGPVHDIGQTTGAL